MNKIEWTQKIYQSSFSLNNSTHKVPTTQTSNLNKDTLQLESIKFVNENFKWLTSSALKQALNELYNVKFDKKDMEYLEKMGLSLPFKSGKEAVQYLAYQNIKIDFDNTEDNDIHANYDYKKNTIYINDKYKSTAEKSTILAISSAILHEASHAKDNDDDTSIQEELECLAMNAIAHRAFVKKYTDIFKDSNEPIINDGVSLYSKLFFERTELNALIERVHQKYGDLPVGSKKHLPQKIAYQVKDFQNKKC